VKSPGDHIKTPHRARSAQQGTPHYTAPAQAVHLRIVVDSGMGPRVTGGGPPGIQELQAPHGGPRASGEFSRAY
jgi:hypothetical protein